MDTRRLRLDGSHPSFDCSAEEFDRLLGEAEQNSSIHSLRAWTMETQHPRCEILEWINAELAAFHSIQRLQRLRDLMKIDS